MNMGRMGRVRLGHGGERWRQSVALAGKPNSRTMRLQSGSETGLTRAVQLRGAPSIQETL